MTNLKMASRVKCTVVVVGDSRVGKTALVQRFVAGTFKEEYSPTSFDKYFASQEVEKHEIEFNFWDTSGSPSYDSVRSLAYDEASVFLLCYKISDPISLYNVKNKWIGDLRRHRPHVPVVLCGCQTDLRTDPATLAHLGKTGRTPVSREQALAICCEVDAVNYVETSSARESCMQSENNLEAFELCALAAIKHQNSGPSAFKRTPSLVSSLSLFDSVSTAVENGGGGHGGGFKRSPSTNSNLSLAANFRMPASSCSSSSVVGVAASSSTVAFKWGPAASPTSPGSLQSPASEPEVRLLRTFSPEPVSWKIPPAISENETYQCSPTKNTSLQGGRKKTLPRPNSLCDPVIAPLVNPDPHQGSNSLLLRPKLQRPTTLFKPCVGLGGMRTPPPNLLPSRGAGFYSPCGEHPVANGLHGGGGGVQNLLNSSDPSRRFESLSELGTPTPTSSSATSWIKSPQVEVLSPTNAQVRPNELSRRTSYRTHPKMAIPVATPMSPVGSEVSFDGGGSERLPRPPLPPVTSPPARLAASPVYNQASSPATSDPFMQNQVLSPAATAAASPPPHIPVFDLKSKLYCESLKSHVSSCSSSQGSSDSGGGSGSCSIQGHKMSPLDFADSSSISLKDRQRRQGGGGGVAGHVHGGFILDDGGSTSTVATTSVSSPDSPADDDDGNQEVIKRRLNFVSPKAGVYRPSSKRKAKQNCAVM